MNTKIHLIKNNKHPPLKPKTPQAMNSKINTASTTTYIHHQHIFSYQVLLIYFMHLNIRKIDNHYFK